MDWVFKKSPGPVAYTVTKLAVTEYEVTGMSWGPNSDKSSYISHLGAARQASKLIVWTLWLPLRSHPSCIYHPAYRFSQNGVNEAGGGGRIGQPNWKSHSHTFRCLWEYPMGWQGARFRGFPTGHQKKSLLATYPQLNNKDPPWQKFTVSRLFFLDISKSLQWRVAV